MLTIFLCIAISGCSAGRKPSTTPIETSTDPTDSSNYVRSNPAANSLDEAISETPFTDYTYDFKVYDDNYMITVTPDEKKTGLTLTLEDKDFKFSTFSVTPPDGYTVYLPYSQNDASTVCTVIRGTESENSLPDILKIDFYLSSMEDETKPYSVCRLYTVSGEKLKEFRVFDMQETSAENSSGEEIGFIPETNIFQSETGKFMADPKITVNEDGSLSVSVVTYTVDVFNTKINCRSEVCGRENPLYYGYAMYAVAGYIYQYFKDTSLNVSDYENYVEIPSADGNSSQYFFKVDDPRFSTVDELRNYVEKYFAPDIVDGMFLSAPQQYRDIDGSLYTIVGDGGHNESLGKCFITGMDEPVDADPPTITYHTKQEKFNDEHEMTGYIDGGDFTVQFIDNDQGFLITQYRYPNS